MSSSAVFIVGHKTRLKHWIRKLKRIVVDIDSRELILDAVRARKKAKTSPTNKWVKRYDDEPEPGQEFDEMLSKFFDLQRQIRSHGQKQRSLMEFIAWQSL